MSIARSQIQELNVTPEDSDDKFVRLRSPPTSAPPPLSISPGSEPNGMSSTSTSSIPPLITLSGPNKITMEQLLAERASLTTKEISSGSNGGSASGEAFPELVTVISRAKAAGVLEAQIDGNQSHHS
jgi:hypothetical protein